MRRFLFGMLMIAAAAAQAEDLEWTPLTGDEIRTALTGRVLAYGKTWQGFRESGRTLYNAGAETWGYWRVQDNQYCSKWPPSDLWGCYDMQRHGDMLRFVGTQGDFTEAVYKD